MSGKVHPASEDAILVKPKQEPAETDADELLDVAPKEDDKEKPDEKRKPVSVAKLMSLCTCSDYVLVFFGVLGALGNACTQPIIIVIFGEMVDTTGPDTIDMMSMMADQVKYMCIVGAGCWVAAGFQSACFRLLAHRIQFRMRILYYEAVLHQDISWFDVREVAALPTEINADINKIGEAFGDKLGATVMSIGCFFASFICAFLLGWQVALVTCGAVPFIMIGSVIMARALQEVVEETQTWYSVAASAVEECLFAFRTIVSFGGENKELTRYSDAVKKARAGGVKNNIRTGVGMGYTEAVMTLIYALALWYGMTLVYGGTNNPSTDEPWTGGEILTVFFCIFIGGFMLSQMDPGMKAMAAGQVAGARIFAAIDNVPIISRRGPDERKTLTEITSFTLKDVHFSYPARPHIEVLKGASLTIKSRQKVAVVGESGSGKSTIMSLLERFYDPSKGTVMVNDMDIKELSVTSLRRHIGYVGQEPVLFAASIKVNIMQGWPEAGQADLERVTEAAQLSFVSGLPDKMETFVGSGGSQFSGGQKQRIAIARALLKKPSVLFLDEATSALDNNSEKMIQSTIDNIGTKAEHGLTIVSIAHRLSTIRSSDVIYTLKEGVVVESGTHSELMNKKGLYYALAASQNMVDEEERATPDGEPQESTSVLAKGKTETASLKKAATRTSDAGDLDEAEAARQKEIGEKYKVPMSRLLSYNKPEWPWLLPGVIGAAGHGASQPCLAYFLTKMLDSFYLPKEEMKDDIEMLAIYFVIVAVAVFFCSLAQIYSFGVLSEAMVMRLRIAILTHVFKQEIGFHDDPKHTPTLIGDALQYWAFRVSILFNQLGANAGVFGSIITGLVIAFVACWQMALVMLGSIPILMVTFAIQMVVVMGGTKQGGQEQIRAQQTLADSVQNARTVHASGIEKVLVKYYTDLVEHTSTGMVWRSWVAGMAFGAATAIPNFVMAGGFYFGAWLVDRGDADFLGVMAAFMGILYAGMGAGQASMSIGDAARAKVACHDMFQLLDRPSMINGLEPEGDTPQMARLEIGEIEFQNIKFYYPFRPEVKVLKGVSFQITAGQSVGLVGPSGGGKSTVMSLIQRFYDPMEGNVLIGRSKTVLSKVNIRWWRSMIGFVGQEPILFDNTVRNNVLYGVEEGQVQDDWLEECKRMSHLSFIDSSKGQGWETQVGPRGSRLSGGQKQRVAICRALVRNPPVLLLDEATSALDTASEKVVQQALESARVGRTSIAIAHRLSTICDCDIILVAAEGVILEQGTHAELMEKHGVYYKLQMQANR